MTLEQFNLSDETEQALAICKAPCVAGRDQGEHKVLLYQLGRFYVEVFYHPRKKLITDYRGIEEPDLYLQEMELDFA